jgi:hypothetical protein
LDSATLQPSLSYPIGTLGGVLTGQPYVHTAVPKGGGIGDVTSDAVGSGARFNDGKVPYELLPLLDIYHWSDDCEHGGSTLTCPQEIAWGVIEHLGGLQRNKAMALHDALYDSVGWNPKLSSFEPAARVFDYGRKKYAAWNWAKGMPWSVPLGCAVRHCLAIIGGEENDPESGLPHIGHVQCNLLMLLVYMRTYPQGNDLPWKYLG